jgi:hypothetical protein
MIWFLRRRNAAEEARKRSETAEAQQSQRSSSPDEWSINPANPMSTTSTLNPMHAAGNSPSNDQVSSPDCAPSHDSHNHDTGSSGFTAGGNSCGDSGGGGGSSFDTSGGSN